MELGEQRIERAPVVAAERPRGRRRRARGPRPLQPISRRAFGALAIGGLASVLAVWSLLSYAGLVDDFFLPSPSAVLAALVDMIGAGFLGDIWASTRRIMLGFLLSALLAVPLGIAIGAYAPVQAFFEPVLGAIRYMPASAFIPLLIIWFGIEETEKVAVIFIGVFFPLTLMVANVASGVRRELLDIAYTLGARPRDVFLRVLAPASLPGIVDNLRIAIGWAWTYLIVAELVAAKAGIGFEILQSSRFFNTEKVLAGIITIGALGLVTDAAFRLLYRVAFPYAQRVR